MREAAWAQLLRAFDDDPRRAAQGLQALIDKLVRLFEWRGCHEPGEAAFEVVGRVAEKLHQGAVLTTSVERYAGGFVNPIFHEYLRRQKKQQKMLDELPEAMGAGGADAEQEAQLICLDRCMEEQLSAQEREILLAFHAHDGARRIQTRRQLAESKQKTVNALRIETHRLRKRLRRCVEECLEAER